MINNGSKEIVGHIIIDNLPQLITGIQYQTYFPIVTASGIRIGDLRVDFDLTMNPVPDETVSKKIRKRSRKRNKNHLSLYSASDNEGKLNQIKRGCKTCSEHSKNANNCNVEDCNKLNLGSPKSPVMCKVPPNSSRSDTANSALWEVLDRGKKLRDAMMLSVMEEDSCEDFCDKLLASEIEKTDYEPLKDNEIGNAASFHENMLIKMYLEGKNF